MVTHYTLQTKDHKIPLREQDLSLEEINLIRLSLRYYYVSLEKSYEQFANEELIDLSQTIKDKLENVRQLRRKLDE